MRDLFNRLMGIADGSGNEKDNQNNGEYKRKVKKTHTLSAGLQKEWADVKGEADAMTKEMKEFMGEFLNRHAKMDSRRRAFWVAVEKEAGEWGNMSVMPKGDKVEIYANPFEDEGKGLNESLRALLNDED